MNTRIIVTGGTLDKIHDPIAESLTFADKSHVPRILLEVRAENVTVEQLMMVDSLDMTKTHQRQILDAIINSPENRIVITHGTSRMAKTAEFLTEAVNMFPDKVVVITGALRPFSFFPSESSFNLGGAILASRVLPQGVYVVMNGRLFTADGKIEKDRYTGIFNGKEYVI